MQIMAQQQLLQQSLNRPASRQRSNRLMVGRDLMPIHQAPKEKKEGVDTVLISDASRSAGFLDEHARLSSTFSSLKGDWKKVSGISAGMSFHIETEQETVTDEVTGESSTIEKNVLVVNRPGQEEQRFDYDGEDARLTTDDNGNIVFLKGGNALGRDGVLRAEKDGDVLFRGKAEVVDSGNFSTTVVGTGKVSGKVTGGRDTTYLGTFANTVIESASGASRFDGVFSGATIFGRSNTAEYKGVFTNSTIDASSATGKLSFSGVFTESKVIGGQGENAFKGSYSGTELVGGKGNDLFDGTFLNNSLLQGLEGNDTFRGLFFHSAVEGGAGNDVIEAEERLHTGISGYYLFASAENSTFDTGEGEDTVRGVFMKSTIEGQQGTVSGAFLSSSVTMSGNKSQNISAFYAEKSSFSTGDSDDSVFIANSFQNHILTGGGENSVTLGAEGKYGSWNIAAEGGAQVRLNGMRFSRTNMEFDKITKLEDVVNETNMFSYGSQQGNIVDATEGDVDLSLSQGNSLSSYNSDSFVTLKEKEAARKETEQARAQKEQAEAQQAERNKPEQDKQTARLIEQYKKLGEYTMSTERKVEKEVYGDAEQKADEEYEGYLTGIMKAQGASEDVHATRLVLGTEKYRDFEGYINPVARKRSRFKNENLRRKADER